MELRLSSKALTKYSLLIGAQLVVNVLLALWLYDEYLHNPYMQMYLSNVFSTIWLEVAIAALGVIVAGFFVLYIRRHIGLNVDGPSHRMDARVGTSENLTTIDACPFCDVPLKTISEGRLQCRNCRRYFKSSLPRITA